MIQYNRELAARTTTCVVAEMLFAHIEFDAHKEVQLPGLACNDNSVPAK